MTKNTDSPVATLLLGAAVVAVILTPILALASVTRRYGLAGLAVAGAILVTGARLIFWVLLPAPAAAPMTCGLESFECTYAEFVSAYSHVPWAATLIGAWSVAGVTIALSLLSAAHASFRRKDRP